jgi:hypothetical protein
MQAFANDVMRDDVNTTYNFTYGQEGHVQGDKPQFSDPSVDCEIVTEFFVMMNNDWVKYESFPGGSSMPFVIYASGLKEDQSDQDISVSMSFDDTMAMNYGWQTTYDTNGEHPLMISVKFEHTGFENPNSRNEDYFYVYVYAD